MTCLFSSSCLPLLCLPLLPLPLGLCLCVLCASVFHFLRLFHSLRALGPDLRFQDDQHLVALDLDLEIVSWFISLESLIHLLTVRDFAITDLEDSVIGFDTGFLGPTAWHNPLDDHTLLPLFEPYAKANFVRHASEERRSHWVMSDMVCQKDNHVGDLRDSLDIDLLEVIAGSVVIGMEAREEVVDWNPFQEEGLVIARTDPFGLPLDIKTLLLVRTGQQIIEFFGGACAIDRQDVLGDSSHHVEVEHRDGLGKIESGVIDVVLAADEAEFLGAESHKEDTSTRLIGR